jgi:predicted aconitase with swiveling domain
MKVDQVLVDGVAAGEVLALDAPLSFWGGVSIESGRIVDPSHPQSGVSLAGKVLVLPHGRGSSSSSSVLAEMIRIGTGPAGIVLDEPDSIMVIGALVADRLYGTRCPIVVASTTPEGRSVWRINGAELESVS